MMKPTTVIGAQERYKINNPWASRLFSARGRCRNKNDARYKTYGGRGIKCLLTMAEIKSIWVRDNAEFMKNPSIDRIDNNGHYELSNCQFIELSDNCIKSNLENPRWITKEGCKHTNGQLGRTKFIDIECPECHKMFRPYNYKLIFCSFPCAMKSRRKEKDILEVKNG